MAKPKIDEGLEGKVNWKLLSLRRKKANGTWQNLEYALTKAERIKSKHELSELPGSLWLRKNGYSSLASAINKYHGGHPHFRKMLGEKERIKKAGTWGSLEYVLIEVERVKSKHELSELPSSPWLRKNGYSSLAKAISDYHGGFPHIRKMLGEKERKKKDGTWQNLEYILTDVERVKSVHGLTELPSGPWLKKNGYASLADAITDHGGFPAFRRLLGEKIKKHENDYWKSIDNVVEAIEKIIQEHKLTTFPTYIQILTSSYSGLSFAIREYHGGLTTLKLQMGYAGRELEVVRKLVEEVR